MNIGLRVFNARNIRSKIADFRYEVDQFPEDIFVVTETFFDALYPSQALGKVCDTHHVCRCDDVYRRGNGGGVMICIPRMFSYLEVCMAANEFFELLSLNVFCKQKKLLNITGVYRSPTPNKVQSLNRLCQVLVHDVAWDNDVPCFLTGDFNLPGSDWDNLINNSAIDHDFHVSMLELGFFQLVRQPTHIRGNVLDLLFCTDENFVASFVVGEPFGNSDHFQISALLGPFCADESGGVPFRNFQLADKDSIRMFLSAIDWNSMMYGLSVEDSWSVLRHCFLSCIDAFVPVSFRKAGTRRRIWSENTVKLHRKQLILHRKFKSLPNEANKLAFKIAYRNARNAKRSDISQSENRLLANPSDRKFWSFVRSRMSNRTEIPHIVNNNLTITDAREKAVLFNEYFCSVYSVDNGIDLPDEHIANVFIENCPIDCNVVLTELKKMKPKLSSGPDSIPQWFLHNFASVVCIPLTKLFIRSLETSVIPIEWKISKIIPVHKKGSKNTVSNYRPVSLLCSSSKIMESAVNNALSLHCYQNNLISNEQHGFRAKRSTVSQLLVTLNEWTLNVDQGNCVDAMYLDIAKAFDSVSHKKLLSKLRNFGVRGRLYAWLDSYLSDRKQFVSVDGSVSSLSSVTSGVPQGSNLGPLLFVIFIDSFASLFENAKVKLYADDSKVYVFFATMEDLERFKSEFDRVALWADMVQLRIAFQKCAVIHFGHRNPNETYTLNDIDIENVTRIRDLGVTVCNSLKFSFHCADVATVGFKMVNYLFSVFTDKSRAFYCKMFVAYILPKLEYASEVWNPSFLSDIRLIERVLKLFTRRLPGIQGRTYDDRLRLLSWDSLYSRRVRKDLIMVYKIVHGLVDVNFHDLFEYADYEGTRGHPYKLKIVRCRLLIRQHFFSVRVIKTWNGLPRDIACAVSLREFKKFVANISFSLEGGQM